MLLGLPIGIYLFKFINKYFDVYYFGCGGVLSLFSGCIVAGGIAVAFVFLLLQQLAVPIIIIILILLFAGSKGSNNGKNDKKEGK